MTEPVAGQSGSADDGSAAESRADERRDASVTSGDEAIAAAEHKFAEASTRNVPVLPDIPHPDDTANLRLGPDLHPSMLALLPLVGVWRGEGEGHDPEQGTDYPFGQQIVITHDGGSYLSWESRSWRLDSDGNYAHPDLRESGFWRVSGGHGLKGSENEEVVELLLTHSTGVVELYYGHALTKSSWELATDVVIRSTSGALVGGARRLYGIVEGGDLAYVEERVVADGPLAPRLSARLSRYIG